MALEPGGTVAEEPGNADDDSDDAGQPGSRRAGVPLGKVHRQRRQGRAQSATAGTKRPDVERSDTELERAAGGSRSENRPQPSGGPRSKASGERSETDWATRVHAAYDEVRRPLWRALVAWSADPDVADEAVAEAFAQLLRRGDEVRDPASWAWRAAFRIAAGELKRRRLAEGPGDDVLARLPAATRRLPDEAVDLVRALAQLSDQQRRCIALVDVAGHTAPSAAAILDTSAATVRVQLMRARRRLRTLLADPADPTRSPLPAISDPSKGHR